MCTLAKVYVIVIVSCITVCHQLCLASCPAGKKLSSNATCEPCPHNSYISETNHTHTLCNDCTKSAPSFAELWYPCNATHNSVYRCINKTFNSNGPDILCQPCRTCTNLVRNCTYDQDSICCFGKNMILKELKSEETCINISSNYQYCCIDSEQTTVKDDVTQMKTLTVQEHTLTKDNTTLANKLEPNKSSDDLDAGKIIGISVSCVIVIAIIIAVVACVYCKRQRTRQRASQVRRKNEGKTSESPFL